MVQVKQSGNEALKSVAIVFLGTILLACGTVTPKESAAIDQKDKPLTVNNDHRTQPVLPPPQVRAALLPPMNIEVPTPKDMAEPDETRFDVAANNVNAREFFMSLVEGTPANLVVDPDVTGEITLNLKNVTTRETLDIVRDIYGYQYQKTRLGYMVFARKIQTRIYSVNYLNIRRTGVSELRISSGHLAETGSSPDNVNAGNSHTSKGDEVDSIVKTSSEVDFWADMQSNLKMIIGEGEGRTVAVNPQSGLVIVKAMPAELKNIDNFIRQLQNASARQVILEAKILEVDLNDAFQSGINWSALEYPVYDRADADAESRENRKDGPGDSVDIQGETGISDQNSLNETPGSGSPVHGGLFSLALDINEFGDFIELLKTQGNVQVLSSPRVSTVNNQKATIKIGSDEYFVTDVDTGVATSATGHKSVNPGVRLTPFFSGIALDLTPQITADGMVMLHIHPSVSEVKNQTKTFTVDDNRFSLPLAFSRTRESDSIIRARNGQIVVVSGLMKNMTDDTVKSELVVLLRAIVIERDQQWAYVRGESGKQSGIIKKGRPEGSLEVFGATDEGNTH